MLPSKAPAAPAATAKEEEDDDSDDDDDEDLDLFGEMTPEEQAAADEKKKVIEAAKKRGAEKAKLTKSMVVLDVKPWDDTTGESGCRVTPQHMLFDVRVQTDGDRCAVQI